VVAISHGGLDDSPYTPEMENGNWYLAQVPGIDAMLLGHSHQLFPNRPAPSPQFNLPGVDKVKGLVFGVPTVMANLWGKQPGRGRAAAALRRQALDDRRRRPSSRARAAQQADKSFVAADPAGAGAGARRARGHHPLREDAGRQHRLPHDDLFRRRRRRLGAAGRERRPRPTTCATTCAPTCRSTRSCRCCRCRRRSRAASPAPDDYTDVAAGSLALNNAADLYLYPNALYAVKVDGAGLKAWLETAAQRFNTIDPARPSRRSWSTRRLPGYNFDTADFAGSATRSTSPSRRASASASCCCAARRSPPGRNSWSRRTTTAPAAAATSPAWTAARRCWPRPTPAATC
jgi:2',3'-cyclic-nucleotide 2'-phosphodiesterase/3'-nucleotidase